MAINAGPCDSPDVKNRNMQIQLAGSATRYILQYDVIAVRSRTQDVM
jgi:hypothetical protein